MILYTFPLLWIRSVQWRRDYNPYGVWKQRLLPITMGRVIKSGILECMVHAGIWSGGILSTVLVNLHGNSMGQAIVFTLKMKEQCSVNWCNIRQELRTAKSWAPKYSSSFKSATLSSLVHKKWNAPAMIRVFWVDCVPIHCHRHMSFQPAALTASRNPKRSIIL